MDDAVLAGGVAYGFAGAEDGCCQHQQGCGGGEGLDHCVVLVEI